MHGVARRPTTRQKFVIRWGVAVFAAIGLSAAAPRLAIAQSRTLTACTPDALAVCTELRLTTGLNLFEIGLRAIGSAGSPALPVSVYNLVLGTGAAAAPSPVSTLMPPVGLGGATVSDASPWEIFDTGDALFLSALTNLGVGGCVAGAPVGGFGQAGRTCAAGEFLTFGLVPARAYDPNAFTLLNLEAVGLTATLPGASCGREGLACVITADTRPTTTAPEPAAVWLLGFGLMLTGVFAGARYRQGRGVPMRRSSFAAHRVRLAMMGSAAAALIGACADPVTTAAPNTVRPARAAIAAASSVTWLAPLGTGTADPSTLDAAAAPEVEICAWTGTACSAAPLARFATGAVSPMLPLTVNAAAGRYEASWDLNNASFTTRRTYRVRVLQGATELGAVSVDVIRGRWALTRADGTLAPLAAASALPIHFSVTAATPADRPAAIAALIYTRVGASQPVVDQIGAIYRMLGIDVLNAERDSAEVSRRLRTGVPFALDFQPGLLDEGLRAGTLAGLDGYLASLTDKGFRSKAGGPLTRAYLAEHLGYLTNKTGLTDGELMPALVLALGRERARRSATGVTDAVWGDGALDALQLSLLQTFLHSVAVRAVAARTPATRGVVADGSLAATVDLGLVDAILSLIERFVGYGVATVELWLAAQCLDQLIANTALTVVATPPGPLYRLGEGDPNISLVRATATYTRSSGGFFQRDLDRLLGCPQPPRGPLPGKTVDWEITGELPEHGVLAHERTTTDASGVARSGYATLRGDVPPELRVESLRRTAAGHVGVRLVDLLPTWPKLEFWRWLTDPAINHNLAAVPLAVYYYELPKELAATFSVELKAPMPGSYEMEFEAKVIMELQSPLVKGGPRWYVGQAPLTYHVTHTPAPGSSSCLKNHRPDPTRGVVRAGLGTSLDQTTRKASSEGLNFYAAFGWWQETWGNCDGGGVELPSQGVTLYNSVIHGKYSIPTSDGFPMVAPGLLRHRFTGPWTRDWDAPWWNIQQVIVETPIAFPGVWSKTTIRVRLP
jgi:hypothetical protein